MSDMRIQQDLTLDAPIDDVRAMLFDPAYREQVLAAQSVLRGTVDVTTEGDTTTVRTEQVQATDKVPSFVRKLTGDEIAISQVERWTGTRAEVNSTVPGAPGTVTGTNELLADGAVTTLRVVRDVTVRLPLVGGKLAQFVGDMHTKALARSSSSWVAYQPRSSSGSASSVASACTDSTRLSGTSSPDVASVTTTTRRR
jgi:hypothetical protein